MQTRSLLIASLGFLSAPVALAASGPGDGRDTTIDTLRNEVAELRATVAQMRAAQEAAAQTEGDRWLNEERAAEIKALVADAVADADSRASLLQNGLTAGYEKGFFLKSSDGNWLLKLSGQLDLRYTWNNAQGQGTLAPAEPDNLYGFEVRRMKLNFAGHVFNPSWEYEVQAAFSSSTGGLVLENAFVNKTFDNGVAIKTGQFKLPFLHEETVSSKRQLAVDRSYVNELYNQDYSKAIQGGYTADHWRVMGAYSDGFASRNTAWNNTTATTSQNSFTGRVEWKVSGDWKQFGDSTSFPGSENALMFGAAANWQANKYGAKTDRFSWTIDGSWKSNGWNLFAYVTGNHLDPATGASADQFGAVIQGGYFFTDKWEVFGRYEYSDLEGLSPVGAALPSSNNLVSIATAGVTWYIDKHNLKWTNDIGIGLDSVPLDQTGIGWRQDAVGEDGQLVVRSQFQLLF